MFAHLIDSLAGDQVVDANISAGFSLIKLTAPWQGDTVATTTSLPAFADSSIEGKDAIPGFDIFVKIEAVDAGHPELRLEDYRRGYCV